MYSKASHLLSKVTTYSGRQLLGQVAHEHSTNLRCLKLQKTLQRAFFNNFLDFRNIISAQIAKIGQQNMRETPTVITIKLKHLVTA